MKSQNQVLMESLEEYYQINPKHLEYLVKVIHENSKISLRVLDWFVTNYSQNNGIVLDNNFDVYENYKIKLASYRKRRFDPFCRKFKINYYTDEENKIETSCGQLLFFKWCFQNNIIKYVEENLETIEKDMKSNTPKKRTKNVVAYKTIKKSSNIKHTITFK